ncbi:MAG: hypothetical protein ACPHRO_03665 [Nannocystaceae bacterium]
MRTRSFDREWAFFGAAQVVVCVGLIGCGAGGAGEIVTVVSDTAAEAGETSGGDGDGDVGGASMEAPRRIVTADWLDRRLSILDYEGFVVQGQSRGEALIKEIDLSPYAPGPLELDVTPDGRRAVVAVGPGFFQGAVGSLIGAGEVPGGGVVLVVDLLTDEVLAELATPEPPMGVVVTSNGATAYTANYGDDAAPGSTVTEIDLTSLEVVGSVSVGSRPEQLALMDGLLAVNAASDGTAIMLDRTASPPVVLGATITSDDPSYPLWMESYPDQVLMTDSQGPGGVSLVDISTPATPSLSLQADLEGIPYAIDHIEGTDEVVVLASRFSSVDLHRLTVGDLQFTSASVPVNVSVAGFPLGVVVSSGKAIFAVPGDGVVVVEDLATETFVTHAWPSEPGPTFVAEAAAVLSSDP